MVLMFVYAFVWLGDVVDLFLFLFVWRVGECYVVLSLIDTDVSYLEGDCFGFDVVVVWDLLFLVGFEVGFGCDEWLRWVLCLIDYVVVIYFGIIEFVLLVIVGFVELVYCFGVFGMVGVRLYIELHLDGFVVFWDVWCLELV